MRCVPGLKSWKILFLLRRSSARRLVSSLASFLRTVVGFFKELRSLRLWRVLCHRILSRRLKLFALTQEDALESFCRL